MNTGTVLVDQIVEAIRSVAGSNPVALHEPSFIGNEKVYLNECIDSTFVSSVGKFVDRFESDLVDYTGAKYAVAVVNGTAALQVALQLAGVSPKDEVLVPALTFIATPNAVSYCGATPLDKAATGPNPDDTLLPGVIARMCEIGLQAERAATGRDRPHQKKLLAIEI